MDSTYKRYLYLRLLLFTNLLLLCRSHVRMVCPRPVSPESEFIGMDSIDVGKQKCLGESEVDQDILEVYPGLFTIKFEETKFIAGSPFRVLLFSASSIRSMGHEGGADLWKRAEREVKETTTTTSDDLSVLLSMVNNTLNSVNIPSNESRSNELGVITDVNSKSINSTEDAAIEISTAPNLNLSTERAKIARGDSSTKATTSETKSTTPSTPKMSQSQEESCVLLDHIPHNDEAVVDDRCMNQGTHFPLGTCDESTYYVTIRIPDLFCPDCYLIVQQVEAKQDDKVCDLSATNGSECISHISCSRISIRPTTEGMDRNLSHCSNYLDNLPDDWAYRPQDVYKAGDKAVLTMDLLHRNLHVEIQRHLSIGPAEKVEIRHKQELVWNMLMADSYRNADSVIVVWEKVPDKYHNILKNNSLILNIIGSKKSQAEDILYQSQVFSEGKISYLHDLYSDHGWLIANRFLGPQAQDPMASLPIGPCVPPARHFVAFFEATDVRDHGLLGMTIMGTRAYITSVLHDELGIIQSIKFKGSPLVGAKDVVVKVSRSFSGVIQVALDLTQQIEYIDTVQFLKTVEVKTNREDAVLVGGLEEGFYSVLRDRRGRVKGMGVFKLTQGYWMRVEIVLSDLSEPSPTVKTARLLGRHKNLLDVSKETSHCTQKFCCLESYVHDLSSDFFLQLQSGQARVEVIVDSDDLSGQIAGYNNCTRIGGLCLLEESISENNAFTEKYGGTVHAVLLVNRAEVLEISVQINHPEWLWNSNENNYSAALIPKGGPIIKIPLYFHWVSEELYIAMGQYPLANQKKTWMFYETDHPIQLKVSNGVRTLMEKEVFVYDGEVCIQRKIHVIGEKRRFWSPYSAPFDTIYGVVMDHLKFIYDNTTSLYLMPSKTSFEQCDFTNAKKTEIDSWINGMAVHFHKLVSPGSLYFADKDSCPSHTPAKLIVEVVKGKDSLVQDGEREEWCRTSFHASWRQEQLSKWEPPSITGPVVLGLFLGLTTGFGFLLWQGMKMKQMPGHSTSASRNSLSHFVRF